MQALRSLGPGAREAFRQARVWFWRFKRDPAQRDRAAATATFAFIAAFAVGGVDAIITGGADFDTGGAYAMEFHAPRAVLAAPVAVATPEMPVRTELTVEAIDYSVATEELLGGPETMLAGYEQAASSLGGGSAKPVSAAIAASTPRPEKTL